MGLVSLATRRRLQELLPIAVLSVAAGAVYSVVYSDEDLPWLAGFVINVLVVGVLIAIGLYVGARRENCLPPGVPAPSRRRASRR